MTEPASSEISAAAAERLAALRTPTKTRSRPAHSWKILSAGLSTTAMFGLVTAMGWPSDAGTVQATTPAAPIVAVRPVVPVAPTVAPLVPVDPATAVPVVIPVAVPVALPVQIVSVPVASNTTTKSSG